MNSELLNEDVNSPVQFEELTITTEASEIVVELSESTSEEETIEYQPPPKTVWREYFQFAVETFVMFLFFITFSAQAVEVPTGSMQNTILIGDHLLVNKFIFSPGTHVPFLPQRDIKRGDILVFKYPGNQYDPKADRPEFPAYKTLYVKRVIGMPGDRLEVRGTSVYINGEPLAERLLDAKKNGEFGPLTLRPDQTPPSSQEKYSVYYDLNNHLPGEAGDTYPTFREVGDGRELIVPADSYFCMGDNRDDSEDSRWWGFVKRDLAVGRPMFVLWSYDRSKPFTGVWSLYENMRWSRIGTWVR